MRLATTSNLGEQRQVSERLIAHLATVGRGGAGIVVTEVLRVHPSNQGRESAIAAYRPEVVPGLQRLADAVHTTGALIERGVRDVHVVGDAFAPRRLADAIRDGHRAGRAV